MIVPGVLAQRKIMSKLSLGLFLLPYGNAIFSKMLTPLDRKSPKKWRIWVGDEFFWRERLEACCEKVNSRGPGQNGLQNGLHNRNFRWKKIQWSRAITLEVGTTNKGQDPPLDYVGPYLAIISRPHPSEGDDLNSIALIWVELSRK